MGKRGEMMNLCSVATDVSYYRVGSLKSYERAERGDIMIVIAQRVDGRNGFSLCLTKYGIREILLNFDY